jgi:hypothetical protein
MSEEEKRPPEEQDDGPTGFDAIPGLVKLGATAGFRTAGWGVDLSLRATRRVLAVAVRPETAPGLVRDIRSAARDVARQVVGMTDIEERGADVARRVAESVPGAEVARRMAEVVPGGPRTPAPSSVEGRGSNGSVDPDAVLRTRGEELLRKSRDVNYHEDAHPAYERLLDSLAPDEARILRLLLLEGPQPAVDIRTGGPVGMLRSRLIAPGLSMIGARAGLRYVERVPSYLNNLNRLGLVWFSRETLNDPLRYQVLEAQPDVLEALHSVRYAKIVRRSIHLTPFGEGFCRASLMPADEMPIELPEHAAPKVKRTATQPPAPS